MKVGAILPHIQCFGGVRRFLEIGNVMVDRGLDYTIYARKERVCNWFDYKGEIANCSNIEADFVMASYPPDFKLLSRVKGKIFIYVLAGGMYIDMYKEMYGIYPFILNNRVFKKWFPESHLVEGAVNVDKFTPKFRLFPNKPRKVLYFDKKSKGSEHIRRELSTIEGIKLIGLRDLNDEELVGAYQSSDFFVSWETRPGWSNTAAEALASGLTVITSGINCEPFIDKVIVVDNLTTFFSNPENLNLKKREQMKEFSWEETVDRLLEIFPSPPLLPHIPIQQTKPHKHKKHDHRHKK